MTCCDTLLVARIHVGLCKSQKLSYVQVARDDCFVQRNLTVTGKRGGGEGKKEVSDMANRRARVHVDVKLIGSNRVKIKKKAKGKNALVLFIQVRFRA